jgi:hypothetical protein
MTDEPDVRYRSEEMHAIAMAIRYDLTSAQAKLTELLRQIALVEPTAIVKCATCGYRPAQNMPSLEEHAYRQHGGPLPAAWARAEALADDWPETEPDIDAVT